MHSFTIISAFASLFAFSSAAAIASPDSGAISVEKRATVSVYLCNDRNFNGYCVDIKSPSGTCVPLGSDLNNLVSSVGPDGSALCYFYVNAGCDSSADFFHVGAPGVADLSVTPVNGPAGSTRNFEDKLSSYACFA